MAKPNAIVLLLVIIFCGFNFGQAQQVKRSLKGSKTMDVRYLGKSPKLTKITAIPSRTKKSASDVYIVPNKLKKTGVIKQIPNRTPDPVMQKVFTTNQANGAQVKVGFDGGSNQDNADVNGIQVAPPDTQGDVGPNHYIQMTNSVTTIFDKSGNTLFGPVPNSVFFQNLDPVLAGTNDGDPIVVYDQFEDRWIVSQFAVDQGAPYFMLIAVSETADPLGAYNQYAISYETDFPDYPKLGIWNDALYITTRDFANGQSFAGFSLVAINKFDMYNGVATSAQRFEIDDPEFDGILPADADGTVPPPAGEPHYSMYLSAGGNSLNLITTTIDFDNPSNSTLVFGSVAVAPYAFFETEVPQPNGQSLDVLPFFLMYRLQYMNFGSYASMLTNHSVQQQAGGTFGVRWYEFRKSSGPWDTYQQGTYLPDDGLNRWMGSIAMNEEGDIALGYSVVSSELNPSIRFAGQTASESGTGILNVPETSILEGTLSSSGTNRWGDYSMMSIDPVDQDFWYTTEYIAQDNSFSGWGTYISEMAFGDPPIAICQDLTVEFDANDGSVSITPEQIDDGSVGPDGGAVTLSLDKDTFDCSNVGENIVTLTATSVEGITASCTAIVTVNVIDTEAPVAVCQDISVELGGSESVEITPEQVDGGSTDNCAIESLSLDQSVFSELGVFTVTLTVTDVAGFTDSCEANVTVLQGAQVEVAPSSLEAAVDLQADASSVVTKSLTVTNNGDVPLSFDVAVGIPDFTPAGQAAEDLANLDRSIFKGKPSSSGTLKATRKEKGKLTLPKPKAKIQGAEMLSNSAIIDSLFYDTGVNTTDRFVGFDDTEVSQATAVRFDIPGENFKLTAVRNYYRTESAANTTILLQVYKGGDLPEEGELLLEQVVNGGSEDGIFAFTQLSQPLTFNAGEHFWIVNVYPVGPAFPQGFDGDVETTRPNTYAFSDNGGETFQLFDGFASLVRALSEGQDGSFITLTPENGTIEPGDSLELSVAFDGEPLANGTYLTDLDITSNDAAIPSLIVPTTFEVAGQTSEIEVSEELLLFNDVFVGVTAEQSFTITNVGGGDLNIASITSDNEVFSADPAFGTVLPGGSLEVMVTYEPTAVGSSNGILSIASDAENAEVVEIVLNGVGVEGPFAVLSPQENFVTLPATESTQVELSLTNEGGSPLVYAFPEFAMAMALKDENTQMQKTEVLNFPNFSKEQSKGFVDTRKGAAVPFGMGIDLVYGYTWMDSDEEGGPVSNFLNIIDFGATDITEFLVGDNGFADGTISVGLPVPFSLYGEEYETLYINANGFVSFVEPDGPTFLNPQLPVEDGINAVIAPFWADLEPGTGDGGTVHIAAFGNTVVVQWTEAPGFNTTGSVTFQLFLFPDGTVDVQYGDMSTA
ncbi:MAG: choice-of-anchor D domain-containing protein, partial [Bacteroidota bacterium]